MARVEAAATGFPTASPLLDTHHQYSSCSEHQVQDLATRMSSAHSLALHTVPEDGADEAGCESCWGIATGVLGCWTAGCSWQAGSQRLPGRACKQTEMLPLRRATSHSCRLLGMTVFYGCSSSHRVTAVLVLEQRCDTSSLGATVPERRSMSGESNQLVERLSLGQSRPVPARRRPTSIAVTQTIAVPLLTVRQSDIGTWQSLYALQDPNCQRTAGCGIYTIQPCINECWITAACSVPAPCKSSQPSSDGTVHPEALRLHVSP